MSPPSFPPLWRANSRSRQGKSARADREAGAKRPRPLALPCVSQSGSLAADPALEGGRRGAVSRALRCGPQPRLRRPSFDQPLREPAVIRLLLSLALSLLASLAVAQAQATDPQNTLVIETSKGLIQIKLRPDLAPKHVAQVKQLAKQGFYDGIIFHRVIAGFMAQTGDPTGTGTGGSKLPDLPAEFSRE